MESIRVATLNIWNRCGPWEERLVAIRTALARLAPDVMGMQEVLRARPGCEGPDQAAAIASGLGYEIAYGMARPGDVELGNAVLSRWPIVRSEVFPLSHGGTAERRSLVFAEIDAPFGRLPFFVTHLNWKLHEGHVREQQVLDIVERIHALAPIEGFPPILVGDFNAEPDADEVRFLRGLCSLGRSRVYFADAFLLAGEGSGITFSRRNPFAALVHEPERRIDYVFVRGPDTQRRGEPLEAAVCFDQPIDGAFPSDHFGVVARISTR
jgi:endonuclease/exonuclease/phosphatase family metal-dependent hydrolase